MSSALQASEPPREEQELTKIERLYLTCKIWGFLKYYHPLVASGSFDWDEKLVSVLNKTKNIDTYEGFSEYMSRWIYYMGERPACRNCSQRDSEETFLANFDLSWTQSNNFSADLRKALKDIEVNRFQGDHHYIEAGKVGQFLPRYEVQLYTLDLDNENQRLIVLFRYWNFIEYFFPYKYITGQEWDEALKEMIPKFLDANNKLDYHLAMLEMVVKIDDSHAGIMTTVLEKMPYYNYLPARFDRIEDKIVITEIVDETKAREQDLQVGDILLSVNGESVQSIHESNKKYIWGSNESVKDRSLYHTLFMGLNESAEVKIERDYQVQTKQLL